MTLKRAWKEYNGLVILTSVLIAAPMCIPIIYPLFAPNATDPNAPVQFLSISMTVFFFICSFVIYLATKLYLDKIIFYLNVKRYTVKTEERAHDFPVASWTIERVNNGGLFRERFHDVFEVKVCLSEERRKYHTFYGPDNYEIAKEKDMVKVLTRDYIDKDGDVIYIEPLSMERSEKS